MRHAGNLIFLKFIFLICAQLHAYQNLRSKDFRLSKAPEYFTDKSWKHSNFKPGRGDFYLSMTTSPGRLDNLDMIFTYLGLKDGPLSKKIKAVIVNIPHYYRNCIKSGKYDEQKILSLKKKYGNKIVFNFVENDWGPITKILPATLRIREDLEYENVKLDDTIVISIDDDMYYSDKLIELLFNVKSNNPEFVIGSNGGQLTDTWKKIVKSDENLILFPDAHWLSKNAKEYSLGKDFYLDKKVGGKKYSVDVIEGWGGIAYNLKDLNIQSTKRMFFLSNCLKKGKNAHLSDDIVISYVLGEDKTQKISLRITQPDLIPKEKLDYVDLRRFIKRHQKVNKKIDERWVKLKKKVLFENLIKYREGNSAQYIEIDEAFLLNFGEFLSNTHISIDHSDANCFRNIDQTGFIGKKVKKRMICSLLGNCTTKECDQKLKNHAKKAFRFRGKNKLREFKSLVETMLSVIPIEHFTFLRKNYRDFKTLTSVGALRDIKAKMLETNKYYNAIIEINSRNSH